MDFTPQPDLRDRMWRCKHRMPADRVQLSYSPSRRRHKAHTTWTTSSSLVGSIPVDEQEEDEFGDQLSRCCFPAGYGSRKYSYLYQDELDHDALQRADVVLDLEDVDRYESLIRATRIPV